jgi:hypothetical protein
MYQTHIICNGYPNLGGARTMVDQMSRIPLSDTVLEEAIANVNQSIVIEKYLLQKAKHIAGNLWDLASTNGAINDIMRQVMELQVLMRNRLQYTEELFQKFGNFYKNGDFVEDSSQELDTFNENEELEE